MNTPEQKFYKYVILVDIAFVTEAATGLRGFMSRQLGRELPPFDLVGWLGYLSMDGGIEPKADHEIQVIFVSDQEKKALTGCLPAQLEALQGQACRTEWGEFLFSVVTPADITDSAHLFMDLTHIILDAREVERLLIVPCDRIYGSELNADLTKFFKEKEGVSDKKLLRFAMSQPGEPSMGYPYDFVGYSILQALGVNPDELQ